MRKVIFNELSEYQQKSAGLKIIDLMAESLNIEFIWEPYKHEEGDYSLIINVPELDEQFTFLVDENEEVEVIINIPVIKNESDLNLN